MKNQILKSSVAGLSLWPKVDRALKLHSTIGLLALMVILACPTTPSALAQSFTTIDVPGSTLTVAQNVNAQGDVVGFYLGSDGVNADSSCVKTSSRPVNHALSHRAAKRGGAAVKLALDDVVGVSKQEDVNLAGSVASNWRQWQRNEPGSGSVHESEAVGCKV